MHPRTVKTLLLGFGLTLVFWTIALGIAAAISHADTDGARLGWFEPIARAAWPTSPCAGQEVVHLDADMELNSEAESVFHVADAQLVGLSTPATCEVFIRSGLDPDGFCTTLTHEFGHLAEGGQMLQAPTDRFGVTHGPIDAGGHTSTPGDIMNGDGNISWAPCDLAVTAARARGRSLAAMRLRALRSPRRRRVSLHR